MFDVGAKIKAIYNEELELFEVIAPENEGEELRAKFLEKENAIPVKLSDLTCITIESEYVELD